MIGLGSTQQYSQASSLLNRSDSVSEWVTDKHNQWSDSGPIKKNKKRKELRCKKRTILCMMFCRRNVYIAWIGAHPTDSAAMRHFFLHTWVMLIDSLYSSLQFSTFLFSRFEMFFFFFKVWVFKCYSRLLTCFLLNIVDVNLLLKEYLFLIYFPWMDYRMGVELERVSYQKPSLLGWAVVTTTLGE